MAFNRKVWLPIAILVVVINVAGGIYASLTEESMHAFVHGALAFGFGLWAYNLSRGPRHAERMVQQPDRADLLEADLSELERELRETQARLDFADQLLRKKSPPASPGDSQPL